MTGIFCPFISCLLHTKTGQHSLPPLYMISGTPPRFTQLSWWNPAIDPHFTPNWQGCIIAKPQQDFPKSAGGAQRTSPEWGESPIVPTLEECIAYAIAPPTNRVHHPPCYPWHPILDRASMRHPLQWDTTIPSPCPCNPWYPIFGPREYASPAPMRHHNPFPLPLQPLVSHIWTARICVTRSNEIPSSLPLISLTSPEPSKH